MRIPFLIALSVVCGSLSAQVKSRLGRFEVDKIQGCAPFTVTLTNLLAGECSAGKPCLVTFEGTTQQQNATTHTYNTAGIFKLSVLYGSITPQVDDITITVDQNIPPDFEIHRCTNNGVEIKVTDNNYEQYVIDFGDSSPTVAIPSGNNAIAQHGYAPAGTYTIQVRGRDSNPNAADNCTAKQQATTTLATLPTPSLTKLATTSGTGVQLTAATITHILYKLEIAINNGTTFQVLQNVYNLQTIDVSNLLLDNNYYCFRLSAFDPCTSTNRYSNTICSQDFDVSFENGTNKLTWRTFGGGVGSVSIIRKDMATSVTQTTSLPGAPLSYDDKDYDCNVQYCYELSLNYAAGVKSTSLQKCGTAIRIITHPAVDDVTGTIINGAADLSYSINPLLKRDHFDILRTTNGSAPVVLTTTSALNVSDPTYTTEGAYCYQVRYVDLCDNYSAEGVLVCPIRLFGSIDEGNIVSLKWTKYKGWKNGVLSYAVEKYDKNNALIRTFNVNLDTFLVDDQPDLANQVVTYTVRANPVTGSKVAYSNVLTFIKQVNLTFPTAFTPNADNLNDVFLISGQYVDKMNIRIFDRWGILVFASESNEPWNGTREGLPMPESSYVWKAEITDLAGRSATKEGTLILLRN